MLKQSKVDVSKQVTDKIQNLTHKYGTTICSYGWDNIARCPLLSVMIVCPSGDIFIGSIHTIGKWKDAHYICSALGGLKPLEFTTLYKFV
jgi:hypothetical protein